MFEVVNTLVVIEISKGKIKTIAIDKPTFVVLSNFLNVFIILSFKLVIIYTTKSPYKLIYGPFKTVSLKLRIQVVLVPDLLLFTFTLVAKKL